MPGIRSEAIAGCVAEITSGESGAHLHRMSEYCRLLAIKAGLGLPEADRLKEAAPFHDIGKVGVPECILGKPGRLDDGEWEVVKRHAWIGYDMLRDSSVPAIKVGAIIALTHHEKWNGTGYPRGIGGRDIPLHGRIAAIADVFDSLTTERSYKAAWPPQRAVEHIRGERARHFDPELVDVFFENADRFIEIRRQSATI